MMWVMIIVGSLITVLVGVLMWAFLMVPWSGGAGIDMDDELWDDDVI